MPVAQPGASVDYGGARSLAASRTATFEVTVTTHHGAGDHLQVVDDKGTRWSVSLHRSLVARARPDEGAAEPGPTYALFRSERGEEVRAMLPEGTAGRPDEALLLRLLASHRRRRKS